MRIDLDPLNPPSTLAPAPLPLPPLPPAMVPFDPSAEEFPYALDYYGTPYLRKPPRVWTVFVVFVVALVAGLVAGGIIPFVMVVAQLGGRIENA
ncbi:MAG TPA: hypothetical protein VGI81_09040, partial [Tepidisphaeraceae bacterium]